PASGLLASRRQRAEQLVRGLTRRQLQVLEHMIAGYRNKQIAGFLAIDEKTVKMHRASLLTRLGIGSSAEAIRIGVEAGLRLNDPG
ncbi:MAG: LuxR C-terminal-related transcriptional regulator, partial [Allosphingosinicella sp.]